MSEWSKIFDGRVGFEAAVWIVTWAAVLMLALIAANLHARLRRLEAASFSERKQAAYRRLVGRRLKAPGQEESDHLWLLLSSNCTSCRTIAEKLETISWQVPTIVVWTDNSQERPRLPQDVRVIENGGEVAEQVGVRVTPFALYVSASGLIERAFPVSSIEPLLQLAKERAGAETGSVVASAGQGGH